MVSASNLSVSEGHDSDSVASEATALIEQKHWSLCNDGKGLERQFKFKTFRATWDFMNHVAAECKQTRHHPEWTNIYNKTHVRWTTHNPVGLSGKDTSMARFCDEAGEKFGEIVEPQPHEQGQGEVEGDDLADAAGRRMQAGGCCGTGKAGARDSDAGWREYNI